MKQFISSKWSLFIVSSLGIVFSSVIIFFLTIDQPNQDYYNKSDSPINIRLRSDFVNQNPKNIVDNRSVESILGTIFNKEKDPSISSTNETAEGSGLPVHLKIPKINLNANLEYVGLTPEGAMEAPKSPNNAAWFDTGPRPGEKGNSIIAGHFGWKNGIRAVFDNLYRLRKGDKIYVENDLGVTDTFIVREIKTYSQNDDASTVFISNDDLSHLNLITCEGTWSRADKSYSNRLVVFTDKEIE